MAKLEFFFDCSSPWTYLAFSRIEAIAQRTHAELIWKPFLVGGVFNKVNQELYAQRDNPNPVKARYMNKDLQDWARYCGVTIRWPDFHPARAVDCMRGAFVAMDDGKLPAYARALFEAYWGETRDIGQHDVLADICRKVGLDTDTYFRRIGEQDVKDRLRANTEEAIARGAFGSPTMYVDDGDMYFGNDRLPLVEAALSAG